MVLEAKVDDARESVEETTFDADDLMSPMNLSKGSKKINLSIQVKEIKHKKLTLELLKHKSLLINDSVDTESAHKSHEKEMKAVAVGDSPISIKSSSAEFQNRLSNQNSKSSEWHQLKEGVLQG